MGNRGGPAPTGRIPPVARGGSGPPGTRASPRGEDRAGDEPAGLPLVGLPDVDEQDTPVPRRDHLGGGQLPYPLSRLGDHVHDRSHIHLLVEPTRGLFVGAVKNLIRGFHGIRAPWRGLRRPRPVNARCSPSSRTASPTRRSPTGSTSRRTRRSEEPT